MTKSKWADIYKLISGMNPFSSYLLRIGILLGPVLYLAAAILNVLAPHIGDYLSMMTWVRGCIEVAPATMLSAALMSFFIDIVLEKEIGVHK